MDTLAEVSLLHAEIALPARGDNVFKAMMLVVSKQQVKYIPACLLHALSWCGTINVVTWVVISPQTGHPPRTFVNNRTFSSTERLFAGYFLLPGAVQFQQISSFRKIYLEGSKSFKSPFFTILAFSLSIELVPCDWLSSYWTEQAKAWRGVSNRVILVISVVTHMHYWQSRCIKAQFLIKCLENNKQKVLSYTWHRHPNQDHVDFGLQKIPCPAASAGTETAFGNNIIHLIPRSGAEFPGKNELLHRKQMH